MAKKLTTVPAPVASDEEAFDFLSTATETVTRTARQAWQAVSSGFTRGKAAPVKTPGGKAH